MLTLGADAGSTYTSVQPSTSNLRVVTLTDGKGDALRALAEPEFVAIATHTDGTYSKITVTGTLFFVHGRQRLEDRGVQSEPRREARRSTPVRVPLHSPTESP